MCFIVNCFLDFELKKTQEYYFEFEIYKNIEYVFFRLTDL